jgi:hypothetical protein
MKCDAATAIKTQRVRRNTEEFLKQWMVDSEKGKGRKRKRNGKRKMENGKNSR